MKLRLQLNHRGTEAQKRIQGECFGTRLECAREGEKVNPLALFAFTGALQTGLHVQENGFAGISKHTQRTRNGFSLCLCVSVVFLSLICTSARAGEITVSGAASLKDALKEIGRVYQKSRPQTRVNFNFGSSGTLQKQIEQGAPIDVFVAASDANLNALLRQNLADKHANFGFARGELVLIAPRGSGLRDLSSVKSVRNFAIGGPGVPAGDYARQVLRWYRLDKTVAPKLVYGKDVRGVLQLVASGNADAGLVYRTDASSTRDVEVIGALSARSHAPIRYPMALLTQAPNGREGRDFVRFCKGAAVKAILRRYGFGT